jgi:hypothetical protein
MPHFYSLDDNFFLPDIGIEPGARIDSRTFSIAANVCHAGTGAWVDRAMATLIEVTKRQREGVVS